MHRFEYKAYRRSFSRDWSTSRKVWSKREGILIRLEDKDGCFGFAEIAPIESFGTESFLSALAVCSSLPTSLQVDEALADLGAYPAMRFALEAALAMIDAQNGTWPELDHPWPVSGLMRDLHDELELERALEFRYQSLKLKIGVGDPLSEKKAIDRIVERSGAAVSIRLDANGVLSRSQTIDWLQYLAEIPAIEYLEQPLAKGQEETMMRIAGDYPTALALDESVCHVDDLKRWRDRQWQGVFVVKPLLCGSYHELLAELKLGEIDVVFSSSLETKIGFANGLAVAFQQKGKRRALGFDTGKLFADNDMGFHLGTFLQCEDCPTSDDLNTLWNLI